MHYFLARNFPWVSATFEGSDVVRDAQKSESEVETRGFALAENGNRPRGILH